MIFAARYHDDDPGLDATRPLSVTHLAAGGAIATPVRRRDRRPERWMRWCWRCFWVALGGTALCTVLAG